jgi:tetratricopeptide (TPR) repeat protein
VHGWRVHDHGLGSELERLFELDELKALSSNLLGLSPDEVGGAAGKATFARALVERVSEEGSTAALLDAMVFSKKGVKELDAASGEDLAAGTTLEGWKILKKLGEGGVGVTYLAEKGSERAAVKVVRFLHARDKGASRRWLVAQRALAQLDDKGLAKVLASGVLADGRPWVATSFVEGQLLGARIARTGPMHFNEARPIVRGVLSALEVLHARGLAHGNVKMENVFVVRPQSDKGASEPTGVLVDAAADRLVARNGAPSSAGQAGVFPVAGSAKAIAPEHARLGRAVPSADVYAVGTLLYEVLTGKLPFSGESAFEVLARHLTTDPEAPSSVAPRGWVSKELDAIVLRALAKNPADRFASASALREALEMIGRVSVPPEARKKEALDQAAFDKAKAALLAKPSDEELAAALERIAAPAEEWKLATDALVAASDKVEEKEAKKALLFRAARLLESDAKDHAGAEGIYKKLLEIDGEDEIARAGLEELKRHSGDAEGLVELLLEKVEREKTAHDRAAVLREIAETYENQLKDEDNAYVAYVQALSEDPRHETTVSAIERLAKGKNERWNEAIGALNEAVAAADGRADKVAMYVLMGRWYADELGRPGLRPPLLLAGRHARSRERGRARRNRRPLPQGAELSRSSPASSSVAPRWRPARQGARLPRRGRRDPPPPPQRRKRATDLYEQVLADDPAHPKATEALEIIYSEKKSWDELAKLLEKKAQNQRGDERVDTLSAIAEVYEDRLSDLDEAATQLPSGARRAAQATSRRSRGSSASTRRRVATKSCSTTSGPSWRRWPHRASASASSSASAGSSRRSSSITRRPRSPSRSIVSIEPGHDGANTALARVYRQLARFDDLAKTLERHALGSSDEKRKIGLLLQSVRVLTVDVGAPDRAILMAERVLAVDPQNGEALELLARLRAQSGDAKSAGEAVRRMADGEKDPVKKADLLVRAGRILEESGDKDGAIAQYKAALDSDKDNAGASSALRSIYSGRGDAHGAAEMLLSARSRCRPAPSARRSSTSSWASCAASA